MIPISEIIRQGFAAANMVANPADTAYQSVARFVLNTNCFDLPIVADTHGVACLEKKLETEAVHRISVFIAHRDDTEEQKRCFLMEELKKTSPVTAERMGIFMGFHKDKGCTRLLDYLVYSRPGEIQDMDDRAISRFTEVMAGRTTIEAAIYFSEFAAWMSLKYQDTKYKGVILVNPRGVRTATDPYAIETYTRLIFYFFNEGNTEECRMYQKACDDVTYASAVAYMSTHLICAVRDTDLMRIHHPALPYAPSETLDKIREGTLSDEEAIAGAEAFSEYLNYLHLSPHKNLAHSGIPDLVLDIPLSLKVHFGKIYLICEAHIKLGKVPGDKPPLFKRVSSYRSLKNLFGDEVADLFREREFCPTAMSKTFLQVVSIVASQEGETLGNETALMFALMLAGWARSHKGTVESFSNTTMTYLTGGSLGLLTPELVASVLFERGVLSCVTSEFLCLLSNEEYKTLDFVQQTALFEELGISPLEIERVMKAFLAERAAARENFKRILSVAGQGEQTEVILSVLQNIAAGLAPGKDPGAHCLLAAFQLSCPDREAMGCLACPYRIETRATLYLAGAEYARLRKLRKAAKTSGSRKKYELITQSLLTSLANTMAAAREVYGNEAGERVRAIVTSALNKEEEKA